MQAAPSQHEEQPLTHRTVYNFGALIALPIDKEEPCSWTCHKPKTTGAVMYFDEPGQPVTWLHDMHGRRIYWTFDQSKMMWLFDSRTHGFRASDACGPYLENLTARQLAAIPACIRQVKTSGPGVHPPKIFDLAAWRTEHKATISASRARFLLTLREVCEATGAELPPDMLREITLAAYPRLRWRQ